MNIDAKALKNAINEHIQQLKLSKTPQELYEPINYLMALGGKRMRPLLALLSYSLYKPNWESILTPAVAIEVFHNFTLMHDDIMDNAPLRRNVPTVHIKWNNNTAILSGDVMLVYAYQLFCTTVPAHLLSPVLNAFNTTAAEVCEGQQLDMLFETRQEVHLDEYMEMIRLKTAVLLGYSLQMGAMLAEAPAQEVITLYQAGIDAGLGFQLMDDYLDCFGDANKTGKQTGGDIISNKKTFMLIRAIELAEGTEYEFILDNLLKEEQFNQQEKVAKVIEIYKALGVDVEIKTQIQFYFNKAIISLQSLTMVGGQENFLLSYLNDLIERES